MNTVRRDKKEEGNKNVGGNGKRTKKEDKEKMRRKQKRSVATETSRRPDSPRLQKVRAGVDVFGEGEWGACAGGVISGDQGEMQGRLRRLRVECGARFYMRSLSQRVLLR